MDTVVFAEIIGPDLLIVLAIVALLFGSSQIPKLARSLGAASKEFRRGLEHGDTKASGPECLLSSDRRQTSSFSRHR